MEGRTVNTDLGIVVAVLDGGRVRIRLWMRKAISAACDHMTRRFQDQIMQTIPMGWDGHPAFFNDIRYSKAMRVLRSSR